MNKNRWIIFILLANFFVMVGTGFLLVFSPAFYTYEQTIVPLIPAVTKTVPQGFFITLGFWLLGIGTVYSVLGWLIYNLYKGIRDF